MWFLQGWNYRMSELQAGEHSRLPYICQLIPPVASLFTRFRPYLAHSFPVFPRFLRVFTGSTRRFQRAPSRTPGPRNSRQEYQEGRTPPFVRGLFFSHRWRCVAVPLSPEISADGGLVYTACQDNGVPGFGNHALLAGQILRLRSSRQLSGTCADTAGGTAAQMLAVNATDGSLVSSFQSETKPSLTSPPDEFAAPRLSADGGAVFVGCANSHLYALNATNLAVLWVGNTGDECTSPTQLLLMVVASLTRKRHRRRREPGGDAEPEHRR